MAASTILSSLGTSIPIGLDPTSKATTIQITTTATSSGANIFAQYTLDTVAPVTWASLSSAIISSNADTQGTIATLTVLSPLAGLRLSSTTTVTGAVTLKSLQSVTA